MKVIFLHRLQEYREKEAMKDRLLLMEMVIMLILGAAMILILEQMTLQFRLGSLHPITPRIVELFPEAPLIMQVHIN